MAAKTLTTITMPQLGESVVEGTIGSWLKQIGDRIDKYDSLVEVETDKASSELPAPVAGVLAEILVEPGSTVAVGTGLCRIQEADSSGSLSDPVPEAQSRPVERVANGAVSGLPPARGNQLEARDEASLLRSRSSPVVRRLAEEHGIDIQAIEGSGAGGRVTKKDILARIEQPGAAAIQRPESQPLVGHSAHVQRVPATVYPGDELVQVTAMRRSIAEHMVRSERTAPHATVVM